MRFIYADNAATTPTDPRVVEAMLPYYTREYGNPSSLHGAGQAAKAALEESRRAAARCLGAKPGQIFFTSGGTESDAWAVLSTAEQRRELFGKHTVICSAIEHPAVLNTCRFLEKEGFGLRLLPADGGGRVSPEALEKLLDGDTALVSVMAVNNETGVRQPAEEIGALCREKGVPFHCDAVQAAGRLPLKLDELPADLLSLSGHKLRGPKGVGLLYAGAGEILPLLHGGGQERGRRPGTENLPGIVGLARALELAEEERDSLREKIFLLDGLLTGGLKELGCTVNGDGPWRLPGMVNARFPGVSSESLLLALDLRGIACSAGAACSAGSLQPSHVLLAMGLRPEEAASSIRFSLSGENTPEEVEEILRNLKELLPALRRKY